MVFFSLLFFSRIENYYTFWNLSKVEATSDYSKELLDKLLKENEQWHKKIEQKQKEIQKIEAELSYLKKSIPSEQTIKDKKHSSVEIETKSRKLTKEIEKTQQVVTKLQQQVADFEKERAILREMRRELLGCEDELCRLRLKATRLADQLAKVQRELLKPHKQTINVQSAPLILTRTELSPVYVALIDGKVVPVQEPFYSITNEIVGTNGHYEQIFHYSWSRKGESLDQAIQKNSVFSKLVESLNPKKQYIALLVDSSSFEVFRRVREVLRSQKIPFGWEPFNGDAVNLSFRGRIVNQVNEE
jgi:cell division protein FtsB